MHVGMAAIFQNPDREAGHSDYSVYQKDMKLALMAESQGFDSVWGIEHHFTDYTMMPDVVDFLSFVGGACRKVKLGTMVVVLPWNDPMRVAEKMSMLDCMSDGRALFGIGRGLARVEFEGFRLNMGDSRERFVESAEMILQGLEQGYCEYDGKHIKQPRARIRPEPFKSFRNRTYAAAVSAESSQIMAKLGIGILVIPQKPWEVHAQELKDYNDLFMQMHGVAAPRPLVAGWVMCDKDGAKAEALARQYISGYWRSVVKHYEMHSDHFSSTKGYEYYSRLNETIEQMGIDGMAEFFMNLQVWGTPEQCFEKIADIHSRTDCCGFNGIFSYAGMPLELGRSNQSLFAREVLPELKKLGARPAFDIEEDKVPAFLRAVG
jgi:alkanesulfonate monooxygenase SsuD/methylene tetrahydromethanopterin reductase-like flavin-dependent oxidoreductase (luciferase family)